MSNANCGLCGYTTCTLFHILCNCTFSLLNKRYNWRHDTVLSTFEPFIRERLRKQNELKEIKRELKQTGFITFIRAGAKPNPPIKKSTNLDTILCGANDWVVRFDYDSAPAMFPEVICATDFRPDIVIWSQSTKTVIIGEQTIPAEENVADAHNRKATKYESLIASCISQGSRTTLFPFEIGCKGFVGFSVYKFCKKLGFLKRAIRDISKTRSKAALRCSYLIYLSRNNQNWKPLNLCIISSNSESVTLDPDDAL